MKRFLFLLIIWATNCHGESLPYVVTVTDFGKQCLKSEQIFGDRDSHVGDKCLEYGDLRRYHLNGGFVDCVSSSPAACDYMYDNASLMNGTYAKHMEKIAEEHPCAGMTVDECEDAMQVKLHNVELLLLIIESQRIN